MARFPNKLLVVQAAALGYDFVVNQHGAQWQGRPFGSIDTCFPAVTCSAQATFRTAAPPALHGMIANGRYFRELRRPMFWEQSSSLVAGPRMWDAARSQDASVAMLFWQQSLGESVDQLISPQPVHKHSGRMIQACYSKPDDLYKLLCAEVGSSFKLQHYWGPLASSRSSAWIAEATAALLSDPAHAPDIALTYLPVLDYDLQRFGPGHPRSAAALKALMTQLQILHAICLSEGYDMLVFGDYAMGTVSGGAVAPNMALAEAGLFKWRDVKGRRYPDFHGSRAFAMVDHEVAHVYVRDAADIETTASVLRERSGVERVLCRADQEAFHVAHPNSGELILIAEPGHWFAYPWWTSSDHEPDYAAHIDIHNKPGYDPCELFWGWPPPSVTRDTERVKGTHGRVGPDRRVAWWSTIDLPAAPSDLATLSLIIQQWLAG